MPFNNITTRSYLGFPRSGLQECCFSCKEFFCVQNLRFPYIQGKCNFQRTQPNSATNYNKEMSSSLSNKKKVGLIRIRSPDLLYASQVLCQLSHQDLMEEYRNFCSFYITQTVHYTGLRFLRNKVSPGHSGTKLTKKAIHSGA